MKIQITLITLLVLLPCLAYSLMNFPRTIWVYWETDFEKAPLITKVSYEKMCLAAKQSNWTVNLVTGKNIHQYIADIDQFQNVVKKARRQSVQQKSDLLRIWLVEENGGVWIDFACIPYENFDWLSNYTSYQHLMINRIGTNLDDPDMFMIGQGSHQSPLSQFNSDGVLVTDEYYGTAIHFIAAKKKAKIMTDWKNKMKIVSALSYEQMLPEWKQKRLFFHTIDRPDVYYSGNIALETVVQMKQLELDKSLTLFSKRLSVYEHYKIWMVHGEVGPIGLIRKHIFKASDLFLFTRQQIENRINKQRFYLKIAAYLRQQIEQHQNRTREYLKKTNKNIQSIIKDGPTNEQCSLWFIVQGSIIHNFYNNSKHFEELKVPIITVQQRDVLRQKCISINPVDYEPIYEPHSAGQFVSPQRQIWSKDKSLRTQLWVWWSSHYLTIKLCFFKSRQTMFLLSLYGIIKFILGKYLKQIITKNSPQGDKNPQFQDLDSKSSIEQSQSQNIVNKQTVKKITIAAMISIGLMHMTFYQIFDCIQQMGKFPMYNTIAYMAVTLVYYNFIVKNQIQSKKLYLPQNTWFIPLETVNLASRLFLFIYAGHCIFMHCHVMWFYAYPDAVLIVGMGYLLYVIYSQLKRRKLADNFVHDFILFFIGKVIPWVMVVFLCLIVYWRNPMYLTSGDHYTKLEFVLNLRIYFDWFRHLSIGYFSIILVKNLFESFSSKQPRNGLSPKLRCQQSIFFIMCTLFWVLTYNKIQENYFKLQENPISVDNKMYMKYFMVHLAVFDFAIRIKMPQLLEMKYKITLFLVCFSFVMAFLVLRFDVFMVPLLIKINWVILSILLAFLALVREITQYEDMKFSQKYKDYKTINESSQIPMSNVKLQNVHEFRQ